MVPPRPTLLLALSKGGHTCCANQVALRHGDRLDGDPALPPVRAAGFRLSAATNIAVGARLSPAHCCRIRRISNKLRSTDRGEEAGFSVFARRRGFSSGWSLVAPAADSRPPPVPQYSLDAESNRGRTGSKQWAWAAHGTRVKVMLFQPGPFSGSWERSKGIASTLPATSVGAAPALRHQLGLWHSYAPPRHPTAQKFKSSLGRPQPCAHQKSAFLVPIDRLGTLFVKVCRELGTAKRRRAGGVARHPSPPRPARTISSHAAEQRIKWKPPSFGAAAVRAWLGHTVGGHGRPGPGPKHTGSPPFWFQTAGSSGA